MESSNSSLHDAGAAGTPPLVTTALSLVDGEAAVLAYRGVRLEEAVALPYAAAAALLLTGDVDKADDIARRLVERPLPTAVIALVAPTTSLPPMARLRIVAAALEGHEQDDDVAWAGCCARAIGVLGPHAPTATSAVPDGPYAFAAAVLRGVAPAPGDGDDAELAHADERAALLDACFVVHLDHALNPSTLAVRVAASVGATQSACFDTGLGTLEGPLHGGASTAVGALLDVIAHPDDVDAVLDDRGARRLRVPGFGHPIYKARDPRAAVLRSLCERAAAVTGRHRVLDVAVRVEELVRTRSQGRLFANVDFYAAALYATLGVPLAWHTPLFFAARSVGWVAHIREQRARGRVLSPEAGYDGPPLRGQDR
ncbi:MAG: citrate/2-methylcitrate synthase [Deltaproteobacteria bacterium]|nr:citrate/2-methylcitrate synthase [Deltaproteobacteria bacterium]